MYVDYTGIRVSDLERSHRLFSEILGLREAKRGTMDHGGVWVLLEDPISHQRIELNWYPPGSKYATAWASGEELDHLGIRTADLEGLARRLIAEGLTEVDRVSEGGEVGAIYLKDPDGIVLELLGIPERLP